MDVLIAILICSASCYAQEGLKQIVIMVFVNLFVNQRCITTTKNSKPPNTSLFSSAREERAINQHLGYGQALKTHISPSNSQNVSNENRVWHKFSLLGLESMTNTFFFKKHKKKVVLALLQP